MGYMACEDLAASLNSKSFMESYLDKLKFPSSPRTPTSVLPDYSSTKSAEDSASYTPLILPVKAIKKLSPIDVKRLSIHMYSHVAQQVRNTLEESKRESEVVGDHVVRDDYNEENHDGFLREQMEALSPPLKSNLASDDNTIPSEPPPPPSPQPLTSTNSKTPPPPPSPPPPPPVIRCHIETPQLPPPPPPPPSGNATTTSTKPGPPLPPPPPPMTPRTLPPPPPPPFQPGKGGAPPPFQPGKGGAPPPPPPCQPRKGGGPPPPPPAIGGPRSLRAKPNKLKRSNQMGSLYRLLKGKVEGSNLNEKSLKRTTSKVGATSGANGKLGMADALAEMTKRSSYFIQIEEDVKNYANSIKEVKSAVTSLQTTDMDELINFHKYVESHLEKLTDETQVLARFEDFPVKKLEGLRMAAALYAKLDAIATTLQNWKIESPVNQLIDKIENYFNKIKGELDTLDRTKDDELNKFKSQNIHFDFAILVRIKELMVEVSSNCMELALKETRETRTKEPEESGLKNHSKKIGSGKILWRAFQFAFRVYTFAGGQDDRADFLTRELAQEIQTDPHL